jgi:ssDNA thymidine ADP-ribosyltransferase, DarT
MMDCGAIENGRPRCPDAVNIAYQDLKGRRSNTSVYVGAGGNLCDYVPFYFATRSPMLFAIMRGLVEGYAGGQAGVIYLVSSCEVIAQAGAHFVFTDGHAVKRLTNQFEDLSELSQIDWPLMRARYWNDTDEDGDRKRRRQAEFLVRDFCPWRFIDSIGVRDEQCAIAVRNALVEAGAPHCPDVKIKPDWYY